jgi:hypothetical protein
MLLPQSEFAWQRPQPGGLLTAFAQRGVTAHVIRKRPRKNKLLAITCLLMA